MQKLFTDKTLDTIVAEGDYYRLISSLLLGKCYQWMKSGFLSFGIEADDIDLMQQHAEEIEIQMERAFTASSN